jgi:serine/threonine protein kinase
VNDEQRPPDGPEPTRLDSAELQGDPDATREGSEIPGNSSTIKRLGDFDLLREIGRGGMGVVYEARQISLKRRVALKVLPPALGMSPQSKQRFEREAQAAAKLHHTHIVPVHAIGEHDGHHFYAMDLIDGQSLDHVLREMLDKGANPLMETASRRRRRSYRRGAPKGRHRTRPPRACRTPRRATGSGSTPWPS